MTKYADRRPAEDPPPASRTPSGPADPSHATGATAAGPEDPRSGSASAVSSGDGSASAPSRPSAGYVIKRSIRGFSADRGTDLAAALTYYAVLSIFPAILALVSLPAVFGQGERTTDEITNIINDIAPASVASDLEGPIEQLAAAPGAGLALAIGIVAALWSASGYVGAFARAMNQVYGVAEGRPFWKLKPLMLLVTLATMLLILAALVMLVVSGPLARSLGELVGVGDTAVTVWNIATWPALLLVVVLIIAVLYYATPNVRQPKFRWLSGGALIAIMICALVSVGFGFYVANFGSYDRTYGSLAGVIVFLLWLWLMNVALMFGAEFDAETERARELHAGEPAEKDLQLEARDTRATDKAAAKESELVERALELRTGQDTSGQETSS